MASSLLKKIPLQLRQKLLTLRSQRQKNYTDFKPFARFRK
jgi:hypothetical protein